MSAQVLKSGAATESSAGWHWQFFDLAGTILLAIGSDGKVRYINAAGAETLGYPVRQILDRDWFDGFLPESSREEVRNVFFQLSAGAANAPERYENRVLCRDGTEKIIAWRNALARDRDGRIVAILSSGEDVTDQRRTESALRETEAQLRALCPRACDGHASRRNDRSLRVRAASSENGGGREGSPLPASDRSHDRAGEPVDERQQLLLHELGHRIANLLTAVQSIARQTLAAGPEQKAFIGRLDALSKAQSLLLADKSESASLLSIAAQVLAPYPAERIAVHGPPVTLAAATAEVVALVLHELATNAVKFGALSEAAGRVTMEWSVDPGEDGDLTLRWTEREGPRVHPPARAGFGSHLIERSTAAAGGQVELLFPPEGLQLSLRIPLGGRVEGAGTLTGVAGRPGRVRARAQSAAESARQKPDSS